MKRKNTRGTMLVRLMSPLMVMIAVMGMHAQAVNQQAASASTASLPPAPPSLPISYGDLIEITVFDTPELSGSLRVNQQGEVELPLGGAVQVKGMTAAQAGTAIAEHLKQAQILLDPHVTVMIVEYQNQGVTVTGEVRTPGIYPILANRTVMDMIALAGGLNENAGKVASVFHRGDPEHVQQVVLNVSIQNPASAVASSVQLDPGDTISVSRSGVIYVVGDVGRPGGFLVEHNDRLTILQALSLAQGANQTASLGKSELIRKTESGRLVYNLDLKQILKGDASDLLLADGDILYVPVSYKKVYTLRGIEALIGVGSQAAIYSSHP
jgi:polysaccharide export outer membrane protein